MSRRVEEAEMVARMASGDSDAALTAFYDRYAGVVMAILMRFLGNRAEAEELLQEVFVELWRRAPQYDLRRAAVSTWVSTVARSRALDKLRARKRRHQDLHVPSEDAVLAAPSMLEPDAIAATNQRAVAVKAALAELKAEQRQVLELAYFKGLSHSEIARHTDLPIGTVKSRILSAMKVLRAHMAGFAEGSR